MSPYFGLGSGDVYTCYCPCLSYWCCPWTSCLLVMSLPLLQLLPTCDMFFFRRDPRRTAILPFFTQNCGETYRARNQLDFFN